MYHQDGAWQPGEYFAGLLASRNQIAVAKVRWRRQTVRRFPDPGGVPKVRPAALFTLCAVVVTVFADRPYAAEPSLQAGVATADITPPPG